MTTLKGAYETLINLRDKMTHLNSVITPKSIDTLKDELGRIFTVIKMHHYTQGQKYGHLASAIPEAKYHIVIATRAWAHTAPVNPRAYSQQALATARAAALQEQHIAQHKGLIKNHPTYLKVEEADKELILYAVGNDALAPLKKQYIRFGNKTMLGMIHHLCMKTAIKMTTAQKHEYRTTGYNTPWDPALSITAYFTQLNHFQISLVDCGITRARQRRWWQRVHRCGTAKCSQKNKCLRGKTSPLLIKRGQTSKRTSPRSGWI
jgi:hypothetical protein